MAMDFKISKGIGVRKRAFSRSSVDAEEVKDSPACISKVKLLPQNSS
jgi:hypothetical protein